MIRIQLAIIYRMLVRDRNYTFTIILVFSLALACVLYLSSYLRYELGYDQHFEGHESVFRVSTVTTTNGDARSYAGTSRIVAPILSRANSLFENYVRIRSQPRTQYRTGELEFYREDVVFADNNMFEVFGHNIIYGQVDGALDNPNSIAISESFSKTYFGDGNSIGRVLSSNDKDFNVTLVFKDLPENTHLKYSAVISSHNDEQMRNAQENPNLGEWFGLNSYTYVKLEDPAMLAAAKTFAQEFDPFTGGLAPVFENTTLQFHLLPLAEVHNDSRWLDVAPTGNIVYIYGFSAFGIILLAVSMMNYANMSIARVEQMSRQFGIRKVLGENKSQFVLYSVFESIFLSVISFLFSIIIVVVFVGILSGSSIDELLGLNRFRLDISLVLIGLFISLGTGFFAGLYPAMYFSSVPLLRWMTMGRSTSSPNYGFSNFLLLLQYVVSISVMTCTLIILHQINFLISNDIGYSPDNKIIATIRGDRNIQRIPVLVNELYSMQQVNAIGVSDFAIGGQINNLAANFEKDEGYETLRAHHFFADPNYLEAMGIEFIEGRNFSKDIESEWESSLIVNETLVRSMGWDDPIGKRMQPIFPGTNPRIVGVVKDFNFLSLHNEMSPMFIVPFRELGVNPYSPERGSNARAELTISMSGVGAYDTIRQIESLLSQFDTENEPVVRNLSQEIRFQYLSEFRMLFLVSLFSLICIIAAGTGVVGLVSYSVARRYSEIGIRKVLGASSYQIVNMFLTRYIWISLLAAPLAFATTFYLARTWFDQYAFSATIPIWLYVLSLLLVIAVTVLTVGSSSYSAAVSNISERMRYE